MKILFSIAFRWNFCFVIVTTKLMKLLERINSFLLRTKFLKEANRLRVTMRGQRMQRTGSAQPLKLFTDDVTFF